MKGAYVVLILLWASCSYSSQTGTAKMTPEKHYDGNWWISVSPERQLGYLGGESDCHDFDLKAKPRTFPRTGAEARALIDDFYKKNPQLRNLSVVEVRGRLHGKVSKAPPGGEVWNEPHAYYDGMWWGSAPDDMRLGFLEGYLSCYAQKRGPKLSFSKAPEEYRALIDKWYDNPSHSSDEKIAHVLHKLQN